MFSDTILAISSPPPPPTPPGESSTGVRGIVRVSGTSALPVARALTRLPPDAKTGWHGGLAIQLRGTDVPCSLLLFKTPRSFTGEDIAEFHLPNSAPILRAVIDSLLASAARLNLPLRPAGPGEFSSRAFFNGKIDLTRAEGIAATINAANQSQLRAAAALREGNLQREINGLAGRVADLLARIEAGIDFADEEGISFANREEVATELAEVGKKAKGLIAAGYRVDRADALPAVVFVGRPNVGKSSLINALAGQQRAIVSEIAGTTRDMLSAVMHTPEGDLRLIDVPGEEAPADDLRAAMMESRRLAILEADVIVQVLDHTDGVGTVAMQRDWGVRNIVLQNKCDLIEETERRMSVLPEENGCGWVSAKTGENLEVLKRLLVRLAIHTPAVAQDAIALNGRHRRILREFAAAAGRAGEIAGDQTVFRTRPELLAAELRGALDLLGEITGSISPDEVLGRIFSQFCIGK